MSNTLVTRIFPTNKDKGKKKAQERLEELVNIVCLCPFSCNAQLKYIKDDKIKNLEIREIPHFGENEGYYDDKKNILYVTSILHLLG